MKIVPQLLYQHPKVRVVLVDGLSSIIHKTIDTIDTKTDHYLASHVISIVLKGKLKVKTFYEGEKFIITKNQTVFIPKGRYIISDIIPKNDEFEAVFYFIEDEVINNFLTSIKPHNRKLNNKKFIINYSDRLQYYTEPILQLYATSNQDNTITKLKLLELLHLLYHSEHKDELVNVLLSLKDRKKKNLFDFMQLNFDKPLKIEDYAYLTGRSLSTFSRDFKRQFNSTPKKWLVHKRLEKSKKLILGDMNIAEVALEVGFESTSHFITTFKKNFAISPKQYSIQNRISVKI